MIGTAFLLNIEKTFVGIIEMASYSQIITLDNLNTVYKDIRDRIDALGDLYNLKGSASVEMLNSPGDYSITLEDGDVYNITTGGTLTSGNLDVDSGDNVLYIKKDPKWVRVGGVYETATDEVAGLVFTDNGGTVNSAANSTTSPINRGLKQSGREKAYVTIPLASDGTYGLISTGKQTFAGEKTFNNKVIASDGLTVGSTEITSSSITVGTDGSTATGTLNINGNATVASTSNLGVVTAANVNVNTIKGSDDKATIEIANGAVITIGDGSNLTEVVADVVDITNLSANGINVGKAADADHSITTENLSSDSIAANVAKTKYIDVTNRISTANLLTVTSTPDDLESESIYTSSVIANVFSVSNKLTANSDATFDKVNASNATLTVNVEAEVDTLDTTTAYFNQIGTDTSRVPTAYFEELTVTENADLQELHATTLYASSVKGINNNCTLNAKTINAVSESDASKQASLIYYNELKKGATGAPAYGEDVDGSYEGILCDKNFGVKGHLYAHKVHNAVWNDLADAIEIDCKPEYGYVYCFDGEHYSKSSKYCQRGVIGIHSDTAGMIMGEKGIENELNCAVAGFVLAHVDKVYLSGTPLTTGKNGTLTKMKKKDLILYPDRLVANFWKPEVGEKWNGVEVNNRCWVKVK